MCESLFKKHPFVMGECDFSFGSYKPPAANTDFLLELIADSSIASQAAHINLCADLILSLS